MSEKLERYLEEVDKCLKPLPITERVDIVKEIKSYMLELQEQMQLNDVQIVEKLGTPKELAREYLGELVEKNTSFRFKNLLAVMAYYGLASATGLVVVPVLGSLSVGFMVSGVLAALAGTVKFAASLLHIDLPFIMFQFGSYTLPTAMAFPLSILVGAALFFGGRALWRVMINQVAAVKRKKETL